MWSWRKFWDFMINGAGALCCAIIEGIADAVSEIDLGD